MDIVQQKKALRQLIRDRKKDYSATYLANLSIPIQGVIESMEVFHKSEIILAYWAMPDEVQTKLLINKWNGCKKFYLPVVVGDDLEFRLYEGAESLEARGQFNILEPTGPLLPNDARVDMILVPGVAFTEKGARLGRGKGYYDRILNRFPEAYKLGIAFGFQMVDEIPMESHDCLMSGVVSGQ